MCSVQNSCVIQKKLVTLHIEIIIYMMLIGAYDGADLACNDSMVVNNVIWCCHTSILKMPHQI